MIKGFKDKGLRQFAATGSTAKLSVQKVDRLSAILSALNVATAPDQMNVPGWRFHELKPRSSGVYSVTISGNWRITFSFEGVDAIDVDLVDYH